MKLLLVRHGQTEENAREIIQGHTPGTLSETGKRQVRRLARRLKTEKIDAIFSSDLKRARDTTQAIAGFHPVPVHYTRQLREKCYGILEGKSSHAYLQAFHQSGLTRVAFRPAGGENYVDLRRRLRLFLKRIHPKYRNKTVLLSTHGGCVKVLLALLRSIPFDEAIRIRTPNASVHVVEVNDGKRTNLLHRTQTGPYHAHYLKEYDFKHNTI